MARINYPDMGGGATVVSIHEIGEPFFIWDNLDGTEAPDNSGTAKYVRLTAGQSGVGGYNHLSLINELVPVPSVPALQVATAEIAIGPMVGEVIPLINTERALLRAGGDSGAMEFDQMQGHRHAATVRQNASAFGNSAGFARGSSTGTTALVSTEIEDPSTAASAGTPRTGDRTRDKARIITAYLRII